MSQLVELDARRRVALGRLGKSRTQPLSGDGASRRDAAVHTSGCHVGTRSGPSASPGTCGANQGRLGRPLPGGTLKSSTASTQPLVERQPPERAREGFLGFSELETLLGQGVGGGEFGRPLFRGGGLCRWRAGLMWPGHEPLLAAPPRRHGQRVPHRWRCRSWW